MNIPAIFVIVASSILYMAGYELLSIQAERERHKIYSTKIGSITRSIRKPAVSKKKKEIIESLGKRIKKRRGTSITFMSTFMPLSLFIASVLVSMIMGVPAVRAPCILPSPFMLVFNGTCYLFSIWICFFLYLVFSPLYLSVIKRIISYQQR